MVTVMDQNWVSIVGPNLTLDAIAKCMNIYTHDDVSGGGPNKQFPSL